MKKNKMLRIASAVMMATLLSTCVISGTFAKYTTSATSVDTARVAKWGVTVTASSTTFAESYATDDANVVGTIANSVVSAETGNNVLAPGTEGAMAAITITGTPEVAVAVSHVATVDLGDNWKDKDNAYYCPLEITVGDTTIKGSEYTTVDEFETAVKAAIDGYTKNYAANTDLSSVNDVAPSVSWAWAFDGDDVKDTALGDQAAAGSAATISLTIETTVTQID